jgi:hypothetical protein
MCGELPISLHVQAVTYLVPKMLIIGLKGISCMWDFENLMSLMPRILRQKLLEVTLRKSGYLQEKCSLAPYGINNVLFNFL